MKTARKSDRDSSSFVKITAPILLHVEISPLQKILCGTIQSLSFKEGYCFASNEYLARATGVSLATIKRDMKVLSSGPEPLVQKHIIKRKGYKVVKREVRLILDRLPKTKAGWQINLDTMLLSRKDLTAGQKLVLSIVDQFGGSEGFARIPDSRLAAFLSKSPTNALRFVKRMEQKGLIYLGEVGDTGREYSLNNIEPKLPTGKLNVAHRSASEYKGSKNIGGSKNTPNKNEPCEITKMSPTVDNFVTIDKDHSNNTSFTFTDIKKRFKKFNGVFDWSCVYEALLIMSLEDSFLKLYLKDVHSKDIPTSRLIFVLDEFSQAVQLQNNPRKRPVEFVTWFLHWAKSGGGKIAVEKDLPLAYSGIKLANEFVERDFLSQVKGINLLGLDESGKLKKSIAVKYARCLLLTENVIYAINSFYSANGLKGSAHAAKRIIESYLTAIGLENDFITVHDLFSDLTKSLMRPDFQKAFLAFPKPGSIEYPSVAIRQRIPSNPFTHSATLNAEMLERMQIIENE